MNERSWMFDNIFIHKIFGFRFSGVYIFIKCVHIWAASWQNQQNDCPPSEDADQTGQIRVFAVRSMGS